ncbi:MAG: 50S ribosomal protein L14 [Elusimicrobiota bacterium]
MIQSESLLNVVDNSGARQLLCINILGGEKQYGRVGDIIVGTVKTAIPSGEVKKGEVVKAVIVRTKYPIKRNDGTVLRFDSNGVVIVDDDGMPKATRVFGPIAMELRNKEFTRIISLAPEVL